MSAYVYANNNPAVYIDPTGERGQLAGCAWKSNPILSQQPDQLAFRTSGLSASQVRFASSRSQIFVPQPFPPIWVPPRTVPPRVLVPRPATTRPGGAVVAGTKASSSTTVVDDEESSTTKVQPSTTAKPGKGKWACTTSCNLQAIGDTKCPDRSSGSGAGSSEGEACRDAKRDATQSAPEGCYPRHCQCPTCTKK
jgi:hypothetical protein